jgi:hypothetical protein
LPGLRSIIAIVLSFAILLQSAGKLIVVLDYQLNKDYISKNLCENKARPKMHCNGKCHLRKQLQKEEKKENNNNAMKERSEVQLFSGSSRLEFDPLSFSEITHQTPYNAVASILHSAAVFHPPCFS